MITKQLTQEDLMEMVGIWNQYKDSIKPGRRKGIEVVRFLTKKYRTSEIKDEEAALAAGQMVLDNAYSREKLEKDTLPEMKIYEILREGPGLKLYEEADVSEKIIVSVDLQSGMYYVEKCALLWDELLCYQGLDKMDLENPVIVAEYVECMKKFGKM